MIPLTPNDSKQDDEGIVAITGKGKLGFHNRRVVVLDAVGGIYLLKKSLKADVGSFEREFMSRAGREMARELLSTIKEGLSGKGSNEDIQKLLDMYSLLGCGDFRISSLDREGQLVKITSSDAIEGWAFQAINDTQLDCACAYTSGVIEEIWRIAFSGLTQPDVEVRCIETDCIGQGKTECVFIVGPTRALMRVVPNLGSIEKDSTAEHVLRLNEEILMKNLELQTLNLGLERQTRKKIEELDRAGENYRNLMAISPDPIMVASAEGNLEIANEQALRLLGFGTVDEARKTSLIEHIVGKKQKWDSIIWQLEKEGIARGQEIELSSRDGTVAHGELHARHVDLPTGRHVVMLFKDDSEKKLMALQMEAAKSESEFLNDLLAHDITNYAMSAMHFLGAVLQSAILSQEDKHKLGIVMRDLQGAFELSTSVRDLSRIKAMSGEEVEIKDLQLIVMEGMEEAERMYSDRSVRMNFTRLSEPTYVRGSQFLTRIFSNLLTNCIKFDPADEVVIDIAIDSVNEGGVGFWRTKITDRGGGIPDSEKERVFEKFHRLDQSISGTGLGLYVARFIASAYGGKVWAENRIPEDHTKGTRMTVMLQKAKEIEIAELSRKGLAVRRL